MKNSDKYLIAAMYKQASAEGVDYEARRRNMVKLIGGLLGGAQGAVVGGGLASAARGGMNGGTGALVGGAVGAGTGVGAAAIMNAIRNYAGFSAMGMPVTAQKGLDTQEKQASAYPHLEKQALAMGLRQVGKGMGRAFGGAGFAIGKKVAPVLGKADVVGDGGRQFGRAVFGGKAVDNFNDVRKGMGYLGDASTSDVMRLAKSTGAGHNMSGYRSGSKDLMQAGAGLLKRPAMIAGGTLAAGGLAGGSHAMGQRSAIKKMQSSYENMSFIQKLMMAMKMMGGQGPAQFMKQYGR